MMTSCKKCGDILRDEDEGYGHEAAALCQACAEYLADQVGGDYPGDYAPGGGLVEPLERELPGEDL
jgi:hypothetical protein